MGVFILSGPAKLHPYDHVNSKTTNATGNSHVQRPRYDDWSWPKDIATKTPMYLLNRVDSTDVQQSEQDTPMYQSSWNHAPENLLWDLLSDLLSRRWLFSTCQPISKSQLSSELEGEVLKDKDADFLCSCNAKEMSQLSGFSMQKTAVLSTNINMVSSSGSTRHPKPVVTQNCLTLR